MPKQNAAKKDLEEGDDRTDSLASQISTINPERQQSSE
jgi:hypothetical protein